MFHKQQWADFIVFTICAIVQVGCGVMVTRSRKAMIHRKRDILRLADARIAESVRAMHTDGLFSHIPADQREEAMREAGDELRIRVREQFIPGWRQRFTLGLGLLAWGLAARGIWVAIQAAWALIQAYR